MLQGVALVTPFSYNRNHSKRTIFQNEEIKKKRIYSIRKNPFHNFNNNSVVRAIQITESLQINLCFLMSANWNS